MRFWILNCNFVFLILIFKFFMVITPAHAWQLPIEVATYNDTGGKIYNRLVAGVESGATDGFDNLWDTPALVTSPDPESQPMLRAYFTLASSVDKSDNIISSPLTGEGKGGGVVQRLWKDTRGPVKGSATWNITIDPVPVGKKVAVSWVTPQGTLKPGERLVLKDDDKVGIDGQPIQTDVTQTQSYEFVSWEEGARSLSLVLSKESSNTSGSSGGSGFGCGTITLHDNRPSGGGTAALGIITLFSPLIFLRLRRTLMLTYLKDSLYNPTIK